MYQVLGIFKCHAPCTNCCTPAISVGYFLLLSYTCIRYQVFSKVMHFISLLYVRHLGTVWYFAPLYKYQVLGIEPCTYCCTPAISVGSCLLFLYTSIRYQVFSNLLYFISLLYLRHLAIVCFFAPSYNYQVFGIFKSHTLHIIDVCETSRYGLVFCSVIQVLGIGYFQMPYTSYY